MSLPEDFWLLKLILDLLCAALPRIMLQKGNKVEEGMVSCYMKNIIPMHSAIHCK